MLQRCSTAVATRRQQTGVDTVRLETNNSSVGRLLGAFPARHCGFSLGLTKQVGPPESIENQLVKELRRQVGQFSSVAAANIVGNKHGYKFQPGVNAACWPLAVLLKISVDLAIGQRPVPIVTMLTLLPRTAARCLLRLTSVYGASLGPLTPSSRYSSRVRSCHTRMLLLNPLALIHSSGTWQCYTSL